MLNRLAEPNQEKPLLLGFLRRRLAVTLILIFVALALLPIIILVTESLSQIETQGDQQAYQRLQAIADMKVDQLNDWLNDRENARSLLLVDPEENQGLLDVLSRT